MAAAGRGAMRGNAARVSSGRCATSSEAGGQCEAAYLLKRLLDELLALLCAPVAGVLLVRPCIAVSDAATVLRGAAGSPWLESVGVCRGRVECRRCHFLQGQGGTCRGHVR